MTPLHVRTNFFAAVLPILALLALPARAPAQEASVAAGTTLLEQQRWDEAADVFRSVAAREPENGLAWYRLGMALQEAGEHAAAIEPLERAARLGFQTPYARVRVARAHAALGHDDAALAALETAADEGLDMPGLLEHDDLAGLADEARFRGVLAAARTAAEPCVHTDAYRAFDFWIGQWNVYDRGGQQVGENRIEPLLASCALLENWTDARGSQGKSLNVYDRRTGLWRQLWVTDRGQITDYAVGRVLEGGEIEFRAEEPTEEEGDVVHRRMVFTPVAADTVTQEIFLSEDGESWSSAWFGVYVRREGGG